MVVESLSKYVDPQDLTVAIHLNRQVQFDPKSLAILKLSIAALWVFGSISHDQSKWGLWGDFLEEPLGICFTYPT